jgi:hypothetical protein
MDLLETSQKGRTIVILVSCFIFVATSIALMIIWNRYFKKGIVSQTEAKEWSQSDFVLLIQI